MNKTHTLPPTHSTFVLRGYITTLKSLALLKSSEMSSTSPSRTKISKPLMERRRRARINACIRELRALLIQARATTSCQSSKLEKAEILEFTVQHLRTLQCPSKDEWSRFCAGYAACAREIARFFSSTNAPRNRKRPDASQNPDPLTHARVWRPWS